MWKIEKLEDLKKYDSDIEFLWDMISQNEDGDGEEDDWMMWYDIVIDFNEVDGEIYDDIVDVWVRRDVVREVVRIVTGK